jgi:peroxiredoxin
MKALLLLSILSITSLSFSQDQMFDICPLKVGEQVPDSLNVVDDSGNVQSLNVLTSGKTIVVFYRGGWCPYCTRHLAQLHNIEKDIAKLGFNMIAITPDQFDSLDVSYERGGNDFKIYSDSKLDVINAFGLGWEIDSANYVKYRDSYGMDTELWTGENHHVLPVPAVYVISDGIVQYNYVNPKYSTRLSADVLLAMLKSLN